MITEHVSDTNKNQDKELFKFSKTEHSAQNSKHHLDRNQWKQEYLKRNRWHTVHPLIYITQPKVKSGIVNIQTQVFRKF